MSKPAQPSNITPSRATLTRRAFTVFGLAAGMLPFVARASSTIDIAAAINGFGDDLFLRQLGDPTRNKVLSPLSLGLCTAMAASGSGGETAAEFEAALRLPLGACVQLPDASYALSHKLKTVTGLSLANAIAFEGSSDEFRPDYVAKVRDRFNGEVLTHATVSNVNAWVREKTNGMIPYLLDDMRDFALINALYFKGAWPHPADPCVDGEFVTGQGESIRVPRMQKTATRGLELPNARTFLLPYKDSTVTMIVVLPARGAQVARIARSLAQDTLKRVLDSTQVSHSFDNLLMPQFKFDAGIDMTKTFMESGLKRMFDYKLADFSGIKAAEAPNLYVEQVVHRCIINVDRLGTEAAAATAEMFRFSGGATFGGENLVEVNRPFLFYLVDRSTDAILMQGCINDPRSKAA